MLKRTLIASAVIISLAFGVTGLLAAEPAPGPVRGEQDLTRLSNDDIVKDAIATVRRMEGQLAESFKLLEESIAANDIAATTVRNEAITAMKGLVRLSEQNLMTLQQRAAERDRQRLEHEYVKITIAAAKVAEFYAQVKSAAGGRVDLDLTDVERRLEFEGSLPVVEGLTTGFSDPVTVPDPPVHASPYF